MELLHQLMLLEDLARDVLGIGVVAVVAVERERHELGIVIGRMRDAHAEEAGGGVAHVARHLAALDGLLLQHEDEGQRTLDALGDLLLLELVLGLLVGDQVGARPAGALRGGHVQAGEVGAADLERSARQRGQVGIARRVDEDAGLHAHNAALGVEQRALDDAIVLLVHLDVDERGVVDDAGAGLQHHVLEDDLAVLGLEAGVAVVVLVGEQLLQLANLIKRSVNSRQMPSMLPATWGT